MTADNKKASASPQRPLRCLLLGEEPLVTRCADVLLEHGHTLAGLVTLAPSVQRWAQAHGVECLRRPDYIAQAQALDFDVMLSITHPALIPASVFSRARVAAINYHDGPLPRYAGMNGSAWALHNGEAGHAVVWHHLTAGLDEGDILEKRDVAFEARETSVSLNMKNSVLTLDSFKAVLRRLETGDLRGAPQRSDIERRIYSRHDRPAHLCVIDWQLPGEQIDRLIRACNFGPYANAFGVAKVIHGAHAVVVHECHLLDEAAKPGVIARCDSEGVVVGTGSRAVRLSNFSTPSGAALTPQQALSELKANVRTRLSQVDREDASAAHSGRIARSEPFYVSALSALMPPSLPFEHQDAGEPCRVPVALPDGMPAFASTNLPAAAIAAFAFLISCLVRDDQFDLALIDTLSGETPVAAALQCPCTPWRIRIDVRRGFAALVAQVRDDLQRLSSRPGFLFDLIGRHPALREQVELHRGVVSSVGVVLPGAALPPGTRLGLSIDQDHCALLSDGSIDGNTIHLLAQRLASLMQRLAGAPERALSSISALDDDERDRQLRQWNDTRRSFPDQLRIHDLFEAQVRIRPGDTALICGDRRLSFAELDQAANRVANVLQSRRVQPGQYVGLLVERSPELVIAMLGIAKSGAAYVPIDTSYPAERARFMLDDSDCVAMLTSSALVDRIDTDRPCLLLDGAEIAQASDMPTTCPAQSSDVCYAIYTSGSTGKPKGVVLTHRAVVNTLDWVNREFKVTSVDRLLFVTSPSFDLSVYDVFGALGAGACVEVADTPLLQDPAALAQRLVDGSITIWDSAPPALARLTGYLPERAAHSPLRLVMLSGDWIPLALPERMQQCMPGVQVKSLGGATEAAIWSNYFHVEHVDPSWKSIPYGYPIQNARYYILDSHLRPLPVGIPGDLYIGGECLAECYLNRPELTAERFLQDPFLPGERIYKTGDLARYGADGTMEFLGRADFQVKIRGFRVEIGEVEAVLKKSAGIADAVCTAHQDGSGQKVLAAYVVVADPDSFDASALRKQLAGSLPDFMLPSLFIPIRAFALTSNGKVDRGQLPSPSEHRGQQALKPASTPTQQALLEIWRGVLARNAIGVGDNFFDLGGHSLAAVSMVGEVRQRLGLSIPLSQILECPTIEQLAQSLDAVRPATASGQQAAGHPAPGSTVNATIELRPGGPRHFFFIHDGDGETLLYRNLAQRMPPDFKVTGVFPRRLPSIALAHESIEKMAACYVDQVVSLQPNGPYHLGGLCSGGVIAFEMASQLQKRGKQVELVVLLDAFEPRARPRSHLTMRRRLQNLRDVLRAPLPADAFGASSTLAARCRLIVDKAINTLRYEVSSGFEALSVSARWFVLRRVLERGTAWPRWLAPLRIQDIYCEARDRYRAPRIEARQVVLVRASVGSQGVLGDRPSRDLFEDSLLGWSGLAERGLQVVDVPGGHSSMLQEPHVDHLAARLAAFMATSTRAAEEARPPQAPQAPQAAPRPAEFETLRANKPT